MSINNQQNNQIYITKEVFIDHIRSDIDQYYEINNLQALGEGGFGQVFEAKKKKRQAQRGQQDNLANSFSTNETSIKEEQTDVNSSDFRAIKVIQYEKSSDKQRMANEIQILSYLDHPSILKLYETIQSRKRLYLVTDLLKGGDLTTVIYNKRNLQEKDIKIIFRQLIKALNYLHSQNICHRDLKPENILFLDEDSLNISIIDFGLAYCWEDDMRKQLKKTGQNKKMVGTPQYMSPQIITRNYDQKCDIWSAGVILYELLYKKTPFEGKNQSQILNNVKNFQNTLEFPEQNIISEEAKNLIQKILLCENQRISLIDILSHPWLSKDQCNCQKCSSDNYSTTSYFSQKKSNQFSLCEKQKQQKKFKTVRSQDRVRKQSCMPFDKHNQIFFQEEGYQSQEIQFQSSPQKLSIQKMQYFCGLSKFEKLMSIYAVSKLSESKTKKYGNQYIKIDKNVNGTIQLDDLMVYLKENGELINVNKETVQYYFNGLCLSQRGYISYTEYLACVLTYRENINKIRKNKHDLNEYDDELDERFTFICMFTTISDHNNDFKLINDSVLEEFFDTLDKNKDGFIGLKDFVNLLEISNIIRENKGLIRDVEEKLEKVEEQEELVKNKVFQWTDDPRKFKRYLSRTYKGEKDGGTQIDIQTFKSWVKGPQKLLKKTIL